jgi:hypothetical protein
MGISLRAAFIGYLHCCTHIFLNASFILMHLLLQKKECKNDAKKVKVEVEVKIKIKIKEN